MLATESTQRAEHAEYTLSVTSAKHAQHSLSATPAEPMELTQSTSHAGRVKSTREKKYRLGAKLVLGISIGLCFAVLLAFITYIMYVSIKTL